MAARYLMMTMMTVMTLHPIRVTIPLTIGQSTSDTQPCLAQHSQHCVLKREGILSVLNIYPAPKILSISDQV